MHSIVLIEMHLPSGPFWPNLLKDKRVEGLSIQEIINKYQGFEGDLISFFDAYDNELEIKQFINENLGLKKIEPNYRLLHVLSDNDKIPLFLREQTKKMGYDVGVCKEEWTIYSSIFHEILFGSVDELVAYKECLNEHFLFPSREIAEEYVIIHHEMSQLGKDVEDYMEMNIYEVWEHVS